ncbi:Na/Pi cotransporter family protein [uncultured Phyllobacterium sp.]|uniref:Na/Pi cotransporter family protein n=1 Tax=uncultured Phyllobacterium sp. TaxID=253813 RepID=UPI00258866AA|nr:Na/Pi cotransporter family protein [uncultured Phyllobacterium sp.]
MQFSLVLLHLSGATMLLLWAVRMVRTGVERAFESSLREALRGTRNSKIKAAAAGAALAVVLQSSTAVAVLASGFAASGVLVVSMGLAILLGADLGSAMVVQILSFDLSWMIPVLLLAGGTLFLKFESRLIVQIGRILLGIAFILLSLHMIAEATAPLRHSEFLPVAIGYLKEDYLTAFFVAALFTWLIHSSVAAILLFVTFAMQGLLPTEVGFVFILGANLGGGLIGFWLTRGQGLEARRLPLGNLIFRGIAAVIALIILHLTAVPLDLLGTNQARQLVNFHLAFNLGLLVFCLPLTGLVERLVLLMLPDIAPQKSDVNDLTSQRISALDRTVIRIASLALASATREVLHMGEVVEIMLQPVMKLLDTGTKAQIEQAQKLDIKVNRAHTDIKLYIAEINRGIMTALEAQRGIELIDFCINLERAGDIIAKNLLVLALEKNEKDLHFSKAGWSELTAIHERVLVNMQLAMNVLVSGDVVSARQLVIEKERMRKLERQSHERHLHRLQSGAQESIETSDIHLEAVRAFKEINSLFASAAYPILTQNGHLLESRLAQPA